MPYLLPEEPAVSELDCVLVYFPNAPEYRQALFGQLAELSDVWNWEGTREAQALARASWLSAELETLNNMSCFDDVLAELQAINAKLPWCCDTSLPTIEIDPVEGPGGILIWPVPGPAPLPIPDNDTGEGTGEYPITPGTDPDDGGTVSAVEWEQYLCGAANFLIDSLIDWLRFVRFQRRFTSQLGSSVRWLQAFIAGRLIPGVMDDFAIFQLDDLIDEVVNAFENVFIEDLDTAITQLGNIRDSAVCAIAGENTAANAINALLNFLSGEITNAFVMSLIGSPATLIASLIWNGALDTDWNDGCDCGIDFDFLHTADQADLGANATHWVASGTGIQSNGSGACTGLYFYNLDISGDNIATRVLDSAAHEGYTLPSNYLSYLMQVEFDICAIYNTVRLTVVYNDGTSEFVDYTTSGTKQFVPANAGIKAVSNGGTYGNGVGIRAQGAPGGAITGMRLWWKVEEV